MISSPYLAGRDRYERVVDGWIDNTHEDAFTHSVRVSDDDGGVELSAVCTPSPGYEVRAARASVLAGRVDPALEAALDGLAGARMVGGFTRRLVELCAGRAGAALLVDAGVEVARLARQAAKLPPASVARLVPGDARACWQLDTTGWVDLPGSCFTYSDAGQALFATRQVSTPMVSELYCPSPGAARIFTRKKRARLVLTGRRLHAFHSMYDNVHGFDVHYEFDLESGVVVAADSITSRLPYAGICSEPQVHIADMIGQRADQGLRKRIQTVLGGDRGCAQLYDLSADLFKLLSLDA